MPDAAPAVSLGEAILLVAASITLVLLGPKEEKSCLFGDVEL